MNTSLLFSLRFVTSPTIFGLIKVALIFHPKTAQYLYHKKVKRFPCQSNHNGCNGIFLIWISNNICILNIFLVKSITFTGFYRDIISERLVSGPSGWVTVRRSLYWRTLKWRLDFFIVKSDYISPYVIIYNIGRTN